MAFYRGKKFDSQEIELKSIIDEASASTTQKPNFVGRLQMLKSLAFLRPFRCVGVICMLHASSGIFIFLSYSASFLEEW